MKVNAKVLDVLQGELKDVCDALQEGWVISELCPSEGWVETQQINPHLTRADYRIEDYKHVMAKLRKG